MSKGILFLTLLLTAVVASNSEQLPEKCFLPKDPGPCHSSKTKYYFNEQTGDCERFTYGGCQGNANRFNSVGDCQDACYTRPNPKPIPERCLLPKAAGPCKMSVTKYYFNEQTGDCERFQYGGCQGNNNRFDTLGQCIDVCRL